MSYSVIRDAARRTAAILLAACLPLAAAMPVSAADTEAAEGQSTPLLTPALRILAARTAMHKSGTVGEEMCFSAADFEKVLGYAPTEITLISLPDRTQGVLKLGTLELSEGVSLSASVLSGLRFCPSAAAEAPVTAAFTFTAAGKAYTTDTALSCMLHLLSTENNAPTAADLAATTYAEIPLYSSLRAADPEADTLTYEIVRAPKKGSITLDAQTGAFVYTPAAGKHGSDTFTYRVSDAWGGESELCRVKLTIRKTDDTVQYSDLDSHWCAAAAMRLTDDGIFSGTTLGNLKLFSPDTAVTRGEFLVSAMRAAGYDADASADSTTLSVFSDTEDIPDYLRGYLSTAYRDGIIRGGTGNGTSALSFAADEAITRAEAAVILYRLFEPETPAVLPVFSAEDEAAIPTWSVGAFSALRAAGILTAGNPADTLDRAQTAQMLSAAMDYCD